MVPTALLSDACAQVKAGDLKEGMGRLLTLRADHSDDLGRSDLATLLTTLVECRLARGELTEAMALGDELAEFLEPDDIPDSSFAAALAHQARGDLAAALGDAETALQHYSRAGALAPDAPAERLPWRCGAALAHLRTGDARSAAALPELREHTLDLLVENHPDLKVARKLLKEARVLRDQASRFTRAKPARGAKQATHASR